MALIDGLLAELEHEVEATERLLACVPAERFDWQPRPGVRTLGELAHHVATLPGAVAEFVAVQTPAQAAGDGPASSAARLLPALAESLAIARRLLAGLDDAALLAPWRLMHGERELFALPRGALLHTLILHNWVQQRAELESYLRALGERVPHGNDVVAELNPFDISEPVMVIGSVRHVLDAATRTSVDGGLGPARVARLQAPERKRSSCVASSL
jgi:hypothetical protein